MLPWWPAILRHPPAAEPEQATIWRALSAGGANWPTALRAAVDAVIDRIAWMTVHAVSESEQPMIDALTRQGVEAAALRADLLASETEAAALRNALLASSSDVERLRIEVERLRFEAAALRSSTSWRVTAPLRALARALGRGPLQS